MAESAAWAEALATVEWLARAVPAAKLARRVTAAGEHRGRRSDKAALLRENDLGETVEASEKKALRWAVVVRRALLDDL